MNKYIKKKWCEALRSGEYEQGEGLLKRNVTNKSQYCCLGVLCDLYAKSGRKPGSLWL